MKKTLVLALVTMFIFSSTASAYSAADWWQTNRRSGQAVEEENEKEEKTEEEENEENIEESESRNSTGSKIQNIADWWQLNRRNGSDASQPSPEEPSSDNEKDGEENRDSDIGNSDEEYIFDMINKERRDRGIQELEYSSEISRVARMKSQDMVENNYFAHQSPTYGSAGDMLRSEGISFTVSKENLARAGDVRSAHQMLMSSSGHRSGILGERYTHVGVGVVETNGGGVKVTQIFVQR
ncbi:CAP domain-containing protein [Natranaerofaba carboxydovora]|uniref:CAP domain-containing protein n=1 Tax=Natranaerofaba carboxydovora TaxID=2742683 RepID=UPI001F13120F|nr:CAP domain-containing protein [Natranaerofaba carboxydovora]UMZ73878.1 Cysteine-rich secretory protein family protein [Natranaerofaba carboxydovora]